MSARTRSDGSAVYDLACVADDGAMRITTVIRGDYHLSNTPRQILLHEALGHRPPRFAHIPLVVGPDGSPLSKSEGAMGLAELRAAREARSAVEARYLAGHAAVFPDEVKAWDEQLRNTETLADVACRLAALDGVPPAEPTDPDVHSARVTEVVADLVEPAKTTALEKLGEGEQAQRIAIGWLRPKLLLATPA